MKEQFCTYEISLKLKELGFDEPCLGYYEVSNNLESGFRLRFIEHEDSNPSKQPSNKDCLAPLWQQTFGWLRKKHQINIIIIDPLSYNITYPGRNYGFDVEIEFVNVKNMITSKFINSGENGFESYQIAREQAILEAIKLIH